MIIIKSFHYLYPVVETFTENHHPSAIFTLKPQKK